MKKSFKKLFAVLFTLATVLALSVTALAASITKDEAKAIAISDSGFTDEYVIYINIKSDNEDGVAVWEVEFTAETLGTYHEYDYTVRKSDGKIIDKDYEFEVIPFDGNNESVDKEVAKGIAVKSFNISLSDAQFIKAEVEHDDGKKIYDIEFVSGDIKCSCEVSSNGIVVEKEAEAIDTFEEKIEVFFELIIAWLTSLFTK